MNDWIRVLGFCHNYPLFHTVITSLISNESKSHLLFAEIPGYCVGFGCDVRKEEDVIKLVSKVIV